MAFDKKSIEEKITKYIYDTFIYDANAKFKSDDSLTKSGYVDSIGIMEFIDFLSKTFSIEIPDSELTPENLDSIQASTKLVLKLRGKKDGSN